MRTVTMSLLAAVDNPRRLRTEPHGIGALRLRRPDHDIWTTHLPHDGTDGGGDFKAGMPEFEVAGYADFSHGDTVRRLSCAATALSEARHAERLVLATPDLDKPFEVFMLVAQAQRINPHAVLALNGMARFYMPGWLRAVVPEAGDADGFLAIDVRSLRKRLSSKTIDQYMDYVFIRAAADVLPTMTVDGSRVPLGIVDAQALLWLAHSGASRFWGTPGPKDGPKGLNLFGRWLHRSHGGAWETLALRCLLSGWAEPVREDAFRDERNVRLTSVGLAAVAEISPDLLDFDLGEAIDGWGARGVDDARPEIDDYADRFRAVQQRYARRPVPDPAVRGIAP